MIDEEKNIFAETNFRNESVRFGIKTDDRRRHMYIIGKSGSGKTNLSEIMAINDIRAGKGLGVIDPHGEFAEKMLDFIPKERLDDVVYFNPADTKYPIAFNPLEQVSSEFRHLVASGIMGVFKKIWVDLWSARMEYILNNTLLALLEYPDATILGVMRMFSDPEYRKKIVSGLKDPVIKGFWLNEYARYSQKFETEAVAAIQNKIGQFVSNPLIRNIIGQPQSSINMREIIDGKKILIANLSKGKMGEDNSRLLGAMMITRIQLAAMSRVDIPEKDRNDFFLYVDEFQNFATDSFASILSEARKYRLSLILAHQYIEQLDEKVQPAVFGNVGTLVCFRVGGPDAEFLEKEFLPEFEGTDLVNLEKYNIYLKLLIDGMAGRPFSAKVLPPLAVPTPSYAEVIIENSRQKYATPKADVEEKIASEWLAAAEGAAGEKVTRRFGESSDRQPARIDASAIRRPAVYGDGVPRQGSTSPQRPYSSGGPARQTSTGAAGGPGSFESRVPGRDDRRDEGFVSREPRREGRDNGFVPREHNGERKTDGFAHVEPKKSDGFVPRESRVPVKDDGFARREPPRHEALPMGGQALPELPRRSVPPQHLSNAGGLSARPVKGEALPAGGPWGTPAPERPASSELPPRLDVFGEAGQRGERVNSAYRQVPEKLVSTGQAGQPGGDAGASGRPQNHQPQKQFLKMEDLAKIPPKQAAHNPVPDPARERASMEDLRKALSERLAKLPPHKEKPEAGGDNQ